MNIKIKILDHLLITQPIAYSVDLKNKIYSSIQLALARSLQNLTLQETSNSNLQGTLTMLHLRSEMKGKIRTGLNYVLHAVQSSQKKWQPTLISQTHSSVLKDPDIEKESFLSKTKIKQALPHMQLWITLPVLPTQWYLTFLPMADKKMRVSNRFLSIAIGKHIFAPLWCANFFLPFFKQFLLCTNFEKQIKERKVFHMQSVVSLLITIQIQIAHFTCTQ